MGVCSPFAEVGSNGVVPGALKLLLKSSLGSDIPVIWNLESLNSNCRSVTLLICRLPYPAYILMREAILVGNLPLYLRLPNSFSSRLSVWPLTIFSRTQSG